MRLDLNNFKDAAKTILVALDNKKKDTPLYDETLELTTEGSTLLLNVTNREYYATVRFDLAEPESFHASVNAQLFLNLISKLTSDFVELTVEDRNVKIKGNGTYKLPLIFKDEDMLELPKIELGTETNSMVIPNATLQSVLKFNSKELQRGTIVKPCQAFYYIDNQGCITFTSGACVNNFTLDQDVKMMLSEKVVKLFKLFKSDNVDFKLGIVSVSDTLTQTRVRFEADNVSITTILPTDSTLINQVPVVNIRGLATKQFPFSIKVSKDQLLEALNRLTLFNSDKNYGRFVFADNTLTVKDWSSENLEKIPFVTESQTLASYEAIINMNNLNLILSGCDDEFVTVSFGDHTAFVVKKQGVSDIIPELLQN